MATVKTIKPAGGGDYTTLQAWEDWADGQASADQWAECYTGGNLGAVLIQTWTGVPDSTHYPRIYTPKDQRHEMVNNNLGAYIEASTPVNIKLNYTRVEGLRIRATAGSTSAIYISPGNGVLITGIVIDSNLLIPITGTSIGYAIFTNIIRSGFGGNVENIYRNNIIYGRGGKFTEGMYLRWDDQGGP